MRKERGKRIASLPPVATQLTKLTWGGHPTKREKKSTKRTGGKGLFPLPLRGMEGEATGKGRELVSEKKENQQKRGALLPQQT